MFPLSSIILQKSALRADEIKIITCSLSMPVGSTIAINVT